MLKTGLEIDGLEVALKPVIWNKQP
jgi:hypothetical protein